MTGPQNTEEHDLELDERDDPERSDVDVLPGAPGRSDTELGDTDQLSDVPAPPAQTR